MKIAHVSFDYYKTLQNEEELLEKHYTVTGCAEALQRLGAEVVVINRFDKNSYLKKNDVQYYFVRDSLPAKLRAWHLPLKLFKKIKSLDADVIHMHHLSLALQTFILRLVLKRKMAIIIQHHGGPPPGKIRTLFYSILNRVADGYFFVDVEQGKEWFNGERQRSKVMSIMEGATFFDFTTRDSSRTFIYHNRSEARKKTGINGSPVFLWAGKLSARKDPLTVLDGFEDLFGKWKDGRLFMIYQGGELLDQVKEKINGCVILKKNVHLIGEISHAEMEDFYNSADYFLLGSHDEGSGYALSEALSCGCVPIVTNIPSFRMMTNKGQLGALWTPGDKNSFILAATIVLNKNLVEEAEACINFYRQSLSFDAIAQTAVRHYQKLIQSRQKI